MVGLQRAILGLLLLWNIHGSASAYNRKISEGHLHLKPALGSVEASSQEAFNELVYGAEHLYTDFHSEAASVNQARTAFLLCASCQYTALKQVTKAPAILSVGVRPYTMRWEYLLKAQGASRFDTIELDATTAIYGSNHAHFQDIAQNIDKHVEANTYDVVIANGVLGWGIDSPTEISEFYFAQARVMKSKGYLILGYNPQVGSNHTAGIEQHFKKVTFGGLPQSTAFDVEWKHLYEFYQKI